MKRIISLLLMGMYGIATAQSSLQNTTPDTMSIQDTATLRTAAEDFLRQQTARHAGQVNISVGQIDKRLKLVACSNLAPFLLQGSKTSGKITLGIRCTTPKPWTVYLSAQIQLIGSYYVNAVPLTQGQRIIAADITKIDGDLSQLPSGAITEPNQIIGRSLATSMVAGSVLRLDILKSSPAIQQGQVVKVTSSGPGFLVTTDGMALNNANEGQIARAKTQSGQVLSGIARVGGVLEISY
ncbi:flagellar basal body P-ring formation chaperone FlgA [soil metagenome]